MTPQLNYHQTSVIHLSLESFYNAGLTPERAKEVIESVIDISSPVRLSASGINNNWSIHTLRTGSLDIYDIVRRVEIELQKELTKHEQRIHSE